VKLNVDTKVAQQKFKQNLAGIGERIEAAMTAAANMAASMIEDAAKADIASAGNFGGRWSEGLHVTVEGAAKNMIISMTHDIPYAGIFEEGGTNVGRPLMWIGISGTDAEGVSPSNYGDKLFSGKSATGTPLLFSISDKQPKFFGTPSITITPKWHLREIQLRVMQNFRTLFDTAFRTG
jgi:hypothetical protein